MTQAVAVLHVVVDQRKVVDKLDSRGSRHGVYGLAAGRLAGEEAECGPQPLAAALGRTAFGVFPAEMVAQHAIEVAGFGAVYEAAEVIFHRPPVTGEGSWRLQGYSPTSWTTISRSRAWSSSTRKMRCHWPKSMRPSATGTLSLAPSSRCWQWEWPFGSSPLSIG